MPNHADPNRARRKTGNRPQRENGAAEVVPVVVPPAPTVPEWAQAPDDLPVGAVDVWDRIVAELLPRRLQPAQLEGVRHMVIAAWRHRQAGQSITEHGLIVQGSFGPVTNPAVKIEKDAAATFLRFAEAYGLTPAAQLRLGLMQLAGESLLGTLGADLDQRAGGGPTVAIQV